jgi:tripartite-type tricarboxylate transporter receptor subunit TctC
MIIPYGQEGISSALGTLLAQKLAARIGQAVTIEFRPGEWGNVGTAFSAKAPPDGYTLHFGNMTHMVYNRFRYPTMPFDALTDFEPVLCTNARIVILVVHKDLPVQSMAELVALGRRRLLSAGIDEHAGYGGICHLLTEKLRLDAGISLQLEARGDGRPVIDRVVSGDIDFMFTNEPPVREALRHSKLRALAITSGTRSELVSALPTMAEAGYPDVQGSGWHGLFVPKGTSHQVVQYLAAELREVLRDEAVRSYFKEMGADAMDLAGERFGAFLRAEVARWPPFVREHRIRTD